MAYTSDVHGDMRRLENELKSVQASEQEKLQLHNEHIKTLQAELTAANEMSEQFKQELTDIKEKYSATCR